MANVKAGILYKYFTHGHAQRITKLVVIYTQNTYRKQ